MKTTVSFDAHFPDMSGTLAKSAIDLFYEMRSIEAIEKKPATREPINWLRALQADPDFRGGELLSREIPYLGVLFKKSCDFQKSVDFVHRRGRFRN